MTERPVTFRVGDDSLIGIVHTPYGADGGGADGSGIGVLIVVGGPQYRVGAHRQFVHLARHLAADGIAAMRFDYRGIGDSEGAFPTFEGIEPDIKAAAAAFREAVPGLHSIVLWGLCDAAAAILMAEDRDPAVTGAVVLNPWVRTESGEARAYLRHYYIGRLVSADFWRKIGRGEFRLAQSLLGLFRLAGRARKDGGDSLPARVAGGIANAGMPVLVILSGNDLVAREFEDAIGGETLARLEKNRVSTRRLPAADHTFSKAAWKDEVAAATAAWVRRQAESSSPRDA